MKVIITDKYNGFKLSEQDLRKQQGSTTCNVFISRNITYQTWKGFGGAFTEASAYNLKRVSKKVKEEALRAYFDKDTGLGYTIGRMSMASSDFSLLPYDYIKEDDENLETFDISREDELVLPLYNEASLIANKKIELLISPWSPSAWMKDNHSRIHGGHLLKKYYDLWSNYYIKFISELKKRDVAVFAVTVQNEPAAVQRWDSCLYTPLEEADFALNFLAKKLKIYHPLVDLYVWDHNRDIVIERTTPIYDLDKNNLIKGTAIHWYDNEPYDNLLTHHLLFPNKALIHTEGCIERGPHFNDYEAGERYARNIIQLMNHYVEAFIDWNLYLDEVGGPNWVNNLCDAPIMVMVNWDSLTYQYSYYMIGQFSKYIRPGAKRIECTTDNSNLLITCFENLDSLVVLVILNQTENDEMVSFEWNKHYYNQTILKRSIVTIILDDVD